MGLRSMHARRKIIDKEDVENLLLSMNCKHNYYLNISFLIKGTEEIVCVISNFLPTLSILSL
jgi:hypothetical protein